MMGITNILTELTFILLHLFIFLLSYYFLDKKITQPAVIFTLVWLTVVCLHLIFRFTLLDQLEAVSERTHITFLLGNIFFSSASILINQYFKIKPAILSTTDPHSKITNTTFRIVITLLALIGLPFYIRAAFNIFLASQAENFFIGLRYELSYGDADIGPLKYFMPFAYVVFAFNLYGYYNKKDNLGRLLLIITFLVIIGYALFATGRTYFFMILSIYLGINLVANQAFSIKRSFAALFIFVSLFMIAGVIYGKGGNIADSVESNLKASSENIGIYVVSAMNAFDIESAQPEAGKGGGENTLRFFIKVAMELDIISPRRLNDQNHQFVFVPYPTNVYTYYSPYTADFGNIFAWVMLAFYGAIHTYLYEVSIRIKSKRSIFYYTFLLFPLLLTFFTDFYLTGFSFWLQIVFFTEVMLFTDKLFVLKKW